VRTKQIQSLDLFHNPVIYLKNFPDFTKKCEFIKIGNLFQVYGTSQLIIRKKRKISSSHDASVAGIANGHQKIRDRCIFDRFGV